MIVRQNCRLHGTGLLEIPRLKVWKFLLYIYHGRLALMGIYASLTARHLTYIYCIFFLCYTFCFKWQINFSLSLSLVSYYVNLVWTVAIDLPLERILQTTVVTWASLYRPFISIWKSFCLSVVNVFLLTLFCPAYSYFVTLSRSGSDWHFFDHFKISFIKLTDCLIDWLLMGCIGSQ